jgi:hypothetical protein
VNGLIGSEENEKNIGAILHVKQNTCQSTENQCLLEMNITVLVLTVVPFFSEALVLTIPMSISMNSDKSNVST